MTNPITIQNADELFDDQVEIDAFQEASNQYLMLGIIAGATLAIEQLVDAAVTPEDVAALPAAVEAIKNMSLECAEHALETTKGSLNKLLQQALEDGWSNDKLADAIVEKYENIKKVRALRIARTETTGAVNKGIVETLKIEGVRYKVWVAIFHNTRDTHKQAHFETHANPVPIGNNFIVGESPAEAPGDSSLPPEERVNCQCTVVSGNFTDIFEKQYAIMFIREHSSIERPFKSRMKKEFEKQLKRVLLRL